MWEGSWLKLTRVSFEEASKIIQYGFGGVERENVQDLKIFCEGRGSCQEIGCIKIVPRMRQPEHACPPPVVQITWTETYNTNNSCNFLKVWNTQQMHNVAKLNNNIRVRWFHKNKRLESPQFHRANSADRETADLASVTFGLGDCSIGPGFLTRKGGGGLSHPTQTFSKEFWVKKFWVTCPATPHLPCHLPCHPPLVQTLFYRCWLHSARGFDAWRQPRAEQKILLLFFCSGKYWKTKLELNPNKSPKCRLSMSKNTKTWRTDVE